MRTIRSLLSPLAAAALCAAAVRPAAAQRATAADYARPVVRNGAATAEAAVIRTVAVYQIQAPREAGMPTRITVADSAGQLVAFGDFPGARAVRPMAVDVHDNDLVLSGETPKGLVTFVLYEQNDPAARGAIAGNWSLGRQKGELYSGR
jgi:hypothetical protein